LLQPQVGQNTHLRRNWNCRKSRFGPTCGCHTSKKIGKFGSACGCRKSAGKRRDNVVYWKTKRKIKDDLRREKGKIEKNVTCGSHKSEKEKTNCNTMSQVGLKAKTLSWGFSWLNQILPK